MPGLSDTSPDVERLMVECYRRMPPRQKWLNLDHDYRLARGIHAAGVRSRRPGVSLTAIQADWIATILGRACPVPVPEVVVEPSSLEFQPILRDVLNALDRLRIGYAIGGSLASSLHGINRMTRDADLTVEPFPGREAVFVSAFPPSDYYVSPEAVREAVRACSTFNILHPTTGYKIDLFVRKDDAFERSAFARRARYPMPALPGDPVLVHAPEDIVLFKLRWYRLGGETSERQWTDILGVLKVQAGRLDIAYLDHWAAELGVADLLGRVRTDAATNSDPLDASGNP